MTAISNCRSEYESALALYKTCALNFNSAEAFLRTAANAYGPEALAEVGLAVGSYADTIVGGRVARWYISDMFAYYIDGGISVRCDPVKIDLTPAFNRGRTAIRINDLVPISKHDRPYGPLPGDKE